MLNSSSTTTVSIDPIDNANGILLLKQGHILKQTGSFNLACVYNMTSLRTSLLKLISLYVTTKNTEDNCTSETFHRTYKDQIEYSLSLIDKKLAFLLPYSRIKKRGLIDGLGTVIKSITGNLDHNDAAKFETEISSLRNSISTVKTSQKLTLNLAEHTITEFNKQLLKIDENQKKLVSILLNATRSSNIINNNMFYLDMYVQIELSLQIILDKLFLIEDAMTFAQLGVMHPSIISPQNLVHEIKTLERQFSFSTVAEVGFKNIHKIERSIVIKAYSTEHSITFILEIPTINPNIYDLIHLYSIPNKQNLTIIPKSKYLALGSEEYAYLGEDCRRISDFEQLCNHLDASPLQDAQDCVIALIQQRRVNCTEARMRMKQNWIQKISDKSWLLIITTRDEIAKSSCGSKTQYQKLIGTYMATIAEGCQLNIMNRTLKSHTNTLLMNEIVPLPEEYHGPDTVRYNIQLEDVSLDNLHDLIGKAEDLQLQTNTETYLPVATPSWPTLLLYASAICWVIWKLYKYRTSKQRASKGNEDVSGSHSVNFHLEEGGITSAQSSTNTADNAASATQFFSLQCK